MNEGSVYQSKEQTAMKISRKSNDVRVCRRERGGDVLNGTHEGELSICTSAQPEPCTVKPVESDH
jgi:hypothetical protein